MSRLIDADDLIKEIRQHMVKINSLFEEEKTVVEIIENQPTAFDTEKVVEQLEEKQYAYIRDNGDYEESKYHALEDAIDIVKKGGVE